MPNTKPLWRYAGFWLALLMALAQAISATRAFADPAAFSRYMGLPVEHGTALAFVTVYALRTALIAFLAAYLALTGRFGVLAVVAFAALPLPLGDAFLANAAGADQAIVLRHLAIAAFLVVTGAALVIAARRRAREE